MTVSILVPAYNAAKYIHQCLESICKQTYRDLQIVVIDDGSSDETLGILQTFSNYDARIEIHSRANKGVAETRNELIAYAKGFYTLFVDADDWLEPDMVETLLDMALHHNAQIAMCANTDENELLPIELEKSKQPVESWTKDIFLKKFLIHRQLTGALWNKLVETKLYKQIRFDSHVSYGEDAMVMWDVLNLTSVMALTTKPLYHYRMNGESLSHRVFSDFKMSVITVWEYISNSCEEKHHGLVSLAKARYGAEVSLLLFEAARNGINSDDNKISILRTKLKALLSFMFKDNNLSWRFMLFATMARFNWTLTSFLLHESNLKSNK